MGWNVAVEFKPSPLHGTGVFALEPIAAGTKVWTLDDKMRIHVESDLRALPAAELAFALHGGYLHAPSDKFVWYDDGMHFVNHATGAATNIGITAWTPLQDDNCTALRDIAVGEELLEDYALFAGPTINPTHWIGKIYDEFCPGHIDFLRSLVAERDAGLDPARDAWRGAVRAQV